MIILTAAFAFLGCGGGGGSSGSVSSFSLSPAESFKAELTGLWQRPCQYNAGLGYIRQSFEFSSVDDVSVMTVLIDRFADASCLQKSVTEVQSRVLSSLNGGRGGWFAGGSLSSQTLTMQTQDAADFHNLESTCGISDWQPGQARDILGTGCQRPTYTTDILLLQRSGLSRALDEVKSPLATQGSVVAGAPYVRVPLIQQAF